MEHSYEIEIKSLLGEKANADALVEKLRQDASFQEKGTHKQLNHYFTGGALAPLEQALVPYLTEEKKLELQKIVSKAKDFSVRTRDADGKVIFVLKASIDDTTSSNGTARLEFEQVIPELSLDALDQLILGAGFTYQAKWSRERSEFGYKDVTVCLDKNAGYGYLAEFERVESDPAIAEQAKAELRALMAELGVQELPQDRLARMFEHYNNHWEEYYGTEKVFTVE